MEKNLNVEFEECVKETKAMLMTASMGCMSAMNGDDLSLMARSFNLMDRFMNLCVAMFEKQNDLMDKLDKVCDKALEQK